MEQPSSQSALKASAVTLRRIWHAMLLGFGLLAVEPARQCEAHRWVSAIFRRLDGLLTRYCAGKLWRVSTPRVGALGRRILNKAAVQMPRKFGWLALCGKHDAVCYGTQIQAVLEQPEMAAMLEASPQAKRILRPLLRALAVQMPWVIDSPRAERPLRFRKPHPKPEPFRIALPRGGLAWARRERAWEQALKARNVMALEIGKRCVR